MVAYLPLAIGLASIGGGATIVVCCFLGALGILTALVRTTVDFREDFFVGLDGFALPDNPSRWTFPITAFLVTSPSSLAIWLADKPSAHSLLSISTRSSVHAILKYSLYRYLDKLFSKLLHTQYIVYQNNHKS
jgi:hypothetical protein